MHRRDVLKVLPPAILGAAFADRRDSANAQVKWSSGTAAPRLKAPAGSADCHHHVYDARFPADPKAVLHPPDALVEDYRGLQRRIGTTRSVIIQPSTYGTDNRCALAALAALGASARMVAVVDDTVTDAELKRLDGLGVRGIRFNLAQAGATTPEMIAPLATARDAARLAHPDQRARGQDPRDPADPRARAVADRVRSSRAHPAARRRHSPALRSDPGAARQGRARG